MTRKTGENHPTPLCKKSISLQAAWLQATAQAFLVCAGELGAETDEHLHFGIQQFFNDLSDPVAKGDYDQVMERIKRFQDVSPSYGFSAHVRTFVDTTAQTLEVLAPNTWQSG